MKKVNVHRWPKGKKFSTNFFPHIERSFENPPRKFQQTAERFCSIAEKKLKHLEFLGRGFPSIVLVNI